MRSVQSTPLMDDGSLVGMVSTHYCRPDAITPQALKQVDTFVAILLVGLRGSDQ